MNKYKRCPSCGTGKIMTDELRRGFNAKIDGKQVCPDCVVNNMLEKLRRNNERSRSYSENH